MYIKNFVVTLILSAFCSVAAAQLQVPPEIKWKTLETEHFKVVVDEKQLELGHLYAKKLERAYFDLSIFFKQFPNQKTTVVINDKTDVTNGYATPLPYQHIVTYPVMPGPDSSLGDTYDWAYELLVHEYTHILTFEAHRGIMKPLRAIFGNIISPVALMPNWWKEGAAVAVESYLSPGGRLNSFYQDANLRGLALSGNLLGFTIDKINDYAPSWPQGARPYLFGSLYWSEIVSTFNPSIMGDLHFQQGGRIPYFIDSPEQSLTKGSYSDVYNKALLETDKRAKKQISTLNSQNISKFTFPKTSFLAMLSPVISPNGLHLALIADRDNHSRVLQLFSKKLATDSFLSSSFENTIDSFNESFVSSDINDSPVAGSIQRVAWFPDSERIVYDKISYTNRIQRYSDLYIHNIKTRNTERLSHGLRAREPSVSPNSENIVFVKLEGGKTSLAILNTTNKSTEVLFEAPLQDRLSFPTFIDNERIIYSYRTIDGTENFEIFSLPSKERSKVLTEYSPARFASISNNEFYFVSAKSGVMNLYKTDLTFSKPIPITNTHTAIFTHTMDHGSSEIIASVMTSTGLKVGILKKEDQDEYSELPIISKIFTDRTNKSPSTFDESTVNPEISDYSAAGYLLPRYWMPFIGAASSDTGITIQASTSGFDPLEKHKYSLAASFDTLTQKGSIAASYVNHQWNTPWLLAASDSNYFLASKENIVNQKSVHFSMMPDLLKNSIYENSQIGVMFDERTFSTRSKRLGAFALYNHSTFSQAGEEVSPESGRSYYAGAYHFIESEEFFGHQQYSLGFNQYLSGFGKHHAINLRMDGMHIPIDSIPVYYGSSTSSMPLTANPNGQRFLLRGYKHGQLLGKSLATLNAEYRFPVTDLYRGNNTYPYFLRRISGAVTVDGASAEGRFYFTSLNATQITKPVRFGKDLFWSTGLEFKLETSLGYGMPITIVMGYYYGFQAEEDARGVLASSLQISGF